MTNWLLMLRQILVNNTLFDWLAAALVFPLSFTALPLLRGILRSRRNRYADHTLPTPVALLAYLADRTSRVVLWILALYVADRILTLPPRLDHAIEIAIVVGVSVCSASRSAPAILRWAARSTSCCLRCG
jgi:hypothetical protein